MAAKTANGTEHGHLIGYARVSTVDQNLQLQIDALLRAGVDERDIWKEKVSGAAKNRPQFEAMMKDLQPGDTVIVWRLDRLGRDNIGLHMAAQRIREAGANLRMLDNSGLDTTTAAGRMMFAMMAAYADFERDVNRERTMAGLAAARARGRPGGARQKFPDAAILAAGRLGMTAGAAKLGMSLSGFIKAHRRVMERQNGQA